MPDRSTSQNRWSDKAVMRESLITATPEDKNEGGMKFPLVSVFTICQNANMAASSTVSTRLDDQELALIQSLAELEGCDRATLIKSLLRKGMAHLRREQAVKAYRREEVTLSKAAELAGMDLWDFLALMETEKLELH